MLKGIAVFPNRQLLFICFYHLTSRALKDSWEEMMYSDDVA